VEFSLVASLLMTMAIGTYELGMAWNDAQLVTQAARSGARVAAQLGSDAQTDQRVLEAIEAGVGNLEPNLVKIVIFDAAATDGQMSASCETASDPGTAGQCSVYTRTHFTTFVQGSWLPSTRNDEINNADYVGIYVEIDRPFLSGFLGQTSLTITDQAVMRIEPNFGP
jgi:Flp pilus assembly protein TadG